MDIWYVTLYEPLPIGGVGIRLMRSGLLANALVNAGHSVELWLPGFEHVHHEHFRKESVAEKINENYTVQYIKGCGYNSDTSFRRLIHNRQVAREFLRLARSRSELPDLIITQVPSLELAEAVVDFAKQKAIPVVVDICDLWPDVYIRLFPRYFHFLYKIIFSSEISRARRIFKNATAITAVSKSYLEWGLKQAKRTATSYDKVFHIGYPATNFVKPANDKIRLLENKYNFSNEKMIIFFAGTFCSSYDLETVFNSARILLEKKILDVEIIIAGGGGEEDAIRKKIEGLDNVKFVGWLDSSELQIFLSLSTVGLAPYSTEALMSLPNKPFEYMAASLPILSSLKGELEQLINDEVCGKCFTANDAVALAEAIIYFRNNPEITATMGMNGRKAFERNYESGKIYSAFENHIKEINDGVRRKKIKGN